MKIITFFSLRFLLNNWKCKWFLSGWKGERPFFNLKNITFNISKIGTANIIKEKGNIPIVSGSPSKMILVNARLKPNKLEPASPIIIFAVPIFDMLKVIFLRLKRGLSPFHPDRNHLHFQLLRRNLSEKKVNIIIYLLVFISLSLSLFKFDFRLAQILFLSSLILFILIIYKFTYSKN